MRPGKAKQRKTDNYKAPDERKQHTTDAHTHTHTHTLSLSLSLSVGNPKDKSLAVNIQNLYKKGGFYR
jgi:hypothetical protein